MVRLWQNASAESPCENKGAAASERRQRRGTSRRRASARRGALRVRTAAGQRVAGGKHRSARDEDEERVARRRTAEAMPRHATRQVRQWRAAEAVRDSDDCKRCKQERPHCAVGEITRSRRMARRKRKRETQPRHGRWRRQMLREAAVHSTQSNSRTEAQADRAVVSEAKNVWREGDATTRSLRPKPSTRSGQGPHSSSISRLPLLDSTAARPHRRAWSPPPPSVGPLRATYRLASPGPQE